MRIINRLFGKKIRGEALENLAKILNVDLRDDFETYEGWSTGDIYAKASTEFKENSIKLTGCFHSNQFHSKENDWDNTKYRKGICFEKSVEIPYDKINLIKKNVSQERINK